MKNMPCIIKKSCWPELKQLKLSRVSILLFMLPLFLFVSVSQAHGQESKREASCFISIKPQAFLFGINAGIEIPLSTKISAGGDIAGHFWFAPSNIAVEPIFKYYFKGLVGEGFYLRGKLVGGYYFNETPFDNHPFYAGAGVGIGGVTPLTSNKRLLIFGDLGLRFAPPFGNRPGSSAKHSSWGMAYYTILSPASIPEASIGLAFAF